MRVCSDAICPGAFEKAPGFLMPVGHRIWIKMKGKTIKTMISEERIREVFTELAAIDSESFSEKEIGKNVAARLLSLRFPGLR